MQSSPLQLEFYYVESLRWKTDAAYEPAGENAPLQASDLKAHLERGVNAGADDEARAAAFRLTLTLDPSQGRFAYAFEIVLSGFFRLDDSVPEEHIAPILEANAPALLYGAAREALATSLGRGPFRPLLLPSVNFLDVQRDSDDQDAPSEETAPAPQKPRRKAKARPSARSKSE